jgi:hypothetical protein
MTGIEPTSAPTSAPSNTQLSQCNHQYCYENRHFDSPWSYVPKCFTCDAVIGNRVHLQYSPFSGAPNPNF